MQWVSTFASGASSLGRPRRLAVGPGPPTSRGKFGETPHLLGNIEMAKPEKKSFARLGGVFPYH